MKLGLFGINMGALGQEPERAVEVARAAEASGWESVWTGEHFALPDPPASSGKPAPPDTAMLEPFAALAHIAAHTTSLLLGTGVTVLPLYQPLALAKQVASLDRVAGGRLLFGVGAGYLDPEFAAFDVPLAARAQRTDEMLEALSRLWSPGVPTVEFAGRTITGLRAEPLPTRSGGPPIHVGGHGAAAARRAGHPRHRVVRLLDEPGQGRRRRCPATRGAGSVRATRRPRRARNLHFVHTTPTLGDLDVVVG